MMARSKRLLASVHQQSAVRRNMRYDVPVNRTLSVHTCAGCTEFRHEPIQTPSQQKDLI